ncbi:MAG: protein kinase [Acidobacteria bacterium]|nr:protein kinase [Acidobacteriota bacterium]
MELDGRAYIAMEYVEGQTLGKVIPAGGLAAKELLLLAIQMADALAAAHKGGVVHRDLKPGNVMVTPEGRAKLLDFGLAKLAEIIGSETTLRSS